MANCLQLLLAIAIFTAMQAVPYSNNHAKILYLFYQFNMQPKPGEELKKKSKPSTAQIRTKYVSDQTKFHGTKRLEVKVYQIVLLC